MVMKTKALVFLFALVACLTSFAATFEDARKLMADGHSAEAYDAFTNFILSVEGKKGDDPVRGSAQSVLDAARCLANAKRVNEVEGFLEKVRAARTEFPVRLACVQARRELPHRGQTVKGEFVRGGYSWENRALSTERDRVIQLRELEELMPQVAQQTHLRQRWFWNETVGALGMNERTGGAAWKLQELTDLAAIPEIREGGNCWGSDFESGAAPVDADGNPVFHAIPASWFAAKTDGERWRFANAERAKVDEDGRWTSSHELATFAEAQFGVSRLVGEQDVLKLVDDLKSLEDDETIARLANGIRRFRLPADYQYLKLRKEIGDWRAAGWEYERRYQFEKAADAFRRVHDTNALVRIVGPNARSEGRVPSVSGRARGTFTVAYRNAKSLTCSVRLLDEEKWRADFRARITRGEKIEEEWKTHPILSEALDYSYQTPTNAIAGYFRADARTWVLPVESAADHSDRRTEVEVPFGLSAGTYLLEVATDGGTRTHSVLKVESLAAVACDYEIERGGEIRIVDAETGAPVAGVRVNLFGWWTRGEERKFRWTEKEFVSDAEGAFAVPELFGLDRAEYEKKLSRVLNGYVTCRAPDGREMSLTLRSFWSPRWYGDGNRDEDAGIVVTDRPAYRPGDTVKYKLWKTKRDYAQDGKRPYAGATVEFKVLQAKDQKDVYLRVEKLDEFGGAAGEFALPADATLGEYRMLVTARHYISGSFRVEEYRKPEFEVAVATPKVAPTLGEKVTATVKANYYYGEPVRSGLAKVTVRRTPKRVSWYPTWDWDWLYGAGSWWWFYDADWYAGPGCLWICRRYESWMPWWRPIPQPETVVSMTVPLDAKGEAKVTWDTAFVRKLYGDDDQEYSLSASVTDSSRRTIDGSGRVLLRAEPFRVFAWTDRPRYRVGDKVTAFSHLDGLDESGVATRVWTLHELDGGKARKVAAEFSATKPGQYRLSCAVTDREGRTREGSRIVNVIGNGDDGHGFRYSALELIPDKIMYAPGETVKLAINADYPDSTVFVRIRDEKTRVVRIKGKSAEISIPIHPNDQPNFFVEAWTFSAAREHREKCEIRIPPVKKVGAAIVEIGGGKGGTFKPGETVTATVRIFDENGKPCAASGVMSVYDKAVDAVAGGSNVRSLRDAFWNWKREHAWAFVSRSGHGAWERLLEGDRRFEPLGLFGSRAIGFAGGCGRKRRENFSEEERGRLDFCKDKSRAVMACMVAEPMSACDALAEAPMAEGGEMKEAEPEAEEMSGVRSEFADTAYWNAALEATGTQGVYRVTFRMPEDITGWNVKVWTMGAGGRVAEVATEIKTKKDLMLRLQAPRFITERDEVVLSANLHNYGASARNVTATLALSGVRTFGNMKPRTFELQPGGEARADWRVKVGASGKLKVRMRVTDGADADGVEKEIDVVSHAIEKTESVFRLGRKGGSGPFATVAPGIYDGGKGRELYASLAPLPKAAADGTVAAVVEVSDTLAGAIDKALPYLKNYEYECTEQTMNRFVPAAVARAVLKERKLDSGQADVDALIEKGLDRLAQYQNSDGGWGWFSGSYERSYEHMTATVVRGLAAAKAAGVKVPDGLLDRGVAWLAAAQKDSLAYEKKHGCDPNATDVLTAYARLVGGRDAADKTLNEMLDRAYDARLKLPFYAQALLGLAFDRTKDVGRRETIVRNLKQFLKTDKENGTAWFELRNGDCWWCWWGSDLEAQAVALMLLLKSEPESDTTRAVALYLHNNRTGRTHWTNTRDTGLAIEALVEYCTKVEKKDRDAVYVSGCVTS